MILDLIELSGMALFLAFVGLWAGIMSGAI
jgi:hypothetical protein